MSQNFRSRLYDIASMFETEFERNFARSDTIHKLVSEYSEKNGRCIVCLEYQSLMGMLNPTKTVYTFSPLDEIVGVCTQKQIDEVNSHNPAIQFVLWILLNQKGNPLVHCSQIVNRDVHLSVPKTALSVEARTFTVSDPF